MLDDLLFLTYDIQAKNLVTFLFRNTAHSRVLFLSYVRASFMNVLYIQESPPKMFLEQLHNLGLLHNKTSS